jgi:hypothetical protein
VDITALDDMELVQMARQRDGAAFRTIMQRSNGSNESISAASAGGRGS